MINLEKIYATKSSGIVSNLHYKPTNSLNEKVTFPLKGTIREKGHRPRYQIWTEEGRACVINDHPDDLDLSATVIEKKYRPATCLDCGHEWKWTVAYSKTTHNLSGESNAYCEKCGSRNVMTEPIKTIYIIEEQKNENVVS